MSPGVLPSPSEPTPPSEPAAGEHATPTGPEHYLRLLRYPPDEAVAAAESALGVSVAAVERNSVGASHAIFFLTLGDGREVVARLAVHPEHDLARDLWAMERCRAAGVPAPRMLATRTDPALGTPYALLSRLPGRNARGAPLTAAQRVAVFRQLGHCLARIHSVSLPGFGPLVPAPGGGYAGANSSLWPPLLAPSGTCTAGFHQQLAPPGAGPAPPGASARPC